jgi:hypothetical protein
MISVAIIVERQRQLGLITYKVYNLLYLLWLLRLLEYGLNVNRRLDTCLNLGLCYSEGYLLLA